MTPTLDMALLYADDTSSSYAHKQLEMVMQFLEEDADAVLRFMASNGLVANQKKTVFMLLNHKRATPWKLQCK